MKKTKKLISVILSLLMVLGMMSTFAFAEDTPKYTITISNDVDGHTYTAYQIFSGDLSTSSETLSNIQWGIDVNTSAVDFADKLKTKYGVTDTNAATIAEKISGETGAREFAKFISNYLKSTGGKNAAYNNTDIVKNYKVSDLEAGYYLIKETGTSATAGGVVSDYIIKLVVDITVNPKDTGAVPTIVKNEKSPTDTEWVGTTTASVGDTIKYKIDVKLPSNLADYDSYYLKITDTMSKGLTYASLDKVYVNVEDHDIKSAVGTPTYSTSADGRSTITLEINDIKTVKYSVKETDPVDTEKVVSVETDIKGNDTITVVYTATLNKDVIGNTNLATNDASLNYSNDPKSTGRGTINAAQVKVYTYNVTFNKVNGKDRSALEGAAFKLSKKNGDNSYSVVKELKNDSDSRSNSDGKGYLHYTSVGEDESAVNVYNKYIFTCLGEGEYKLEETVTPDGFNTLDGALVFKIDAEGNLYMQSGSSWVACNNNIYDIENNKGATLPSTGGIGTTIFYLLGAILVVGAGVVFVTRRRMHSDK